MELSVLNSVTVHRISGVDICLCTGHAVVFRGDSNNVETVRDRMQVSVNHSL